jgi:predicted nucleic-acid-binding protein
MIGLDTNVLVRYLTQDDPEQSVRASYLIESECTRHKPGRISLVVLCELAWVLDGAYGYKKKLVVQVLENIMASRELSVENEGIARSALAAFRRGRADFADYVIVFSNRNAGCEATYSFDRDLASHDFVHLL